MSVFRKSLPRSILATWMLRLGTPHLPAATETWAPTAAGTDNWHSASNWSPATVPNAVGEVALMKTGITGAQTILLNQAITLGTLSLQAGTFAAGSPTLQAADGSNPQKIDVYNPPQSPSFIRSTGFFALNQNNSHGAH
jgi:hypothetical protein